MLKKASIFRILGIVGGAVLAVAAVAALVLVLRNRQNGTGNTNGTNGTAATATVHYSTNAGTATADADHDGLTDAEEQVLGTNPADTDTDHDGLSDFDEVKKYHTDPNKAHSGTLSLNDGDAVKKGLNPLNGEKLFATTPPANNNTNN